MGKFIDLTGQRFGRLVVIRQNGRAANKSKKVLWLCQCDCGNQCTVSGDRLKRGDTKSCGCLKKELVRNRNLSKGKGGESSTRLYKIWTDMLGRCENPKVWCFAYYGGRGISVCPEWQDSFLTFKAWAMESGYSESLTIDRIDVNGPYSPQNCRWADALVQSNNMRSNRIITYNGQTMTIAMWARQLGISHVTLRSRIQRGWSIERALTEPLHKNK